MATREAQQIYRQRSQIAEFPHAWIKERCGLRRFRCRGRLKVTMEASWACLSYNLSRWFGRAAGSIWNSLRLSGSRTVRRSSVVFWRFLPPLYEPSSIKSALQAQKLFLHSFQTGRSPVKQQPAFNNSPRAASGNFRGLAGRLLYFFPGCRTISKTTICWKTLRFYAGAGSTRARQLTAPTCGALTSACSRTPRTSFIKWRV